MLEHGVGVEVGACRLHEHGPLDTSPLEKWLEILRPKVRRMTACSSVSHGWASRSRFQKCWWVSTGIAVALVSSFETTLILLVSGPVTPDQAIVEPTERSIPRVTI